MLRLAVLPAFILMSGSVALAAPSISVVGANQGYATVRITTDEPGALAAELAVTVQGYGRLGDITINSSLFDDPNPGDNPFIEGSPEGGDTTGLWIDLEGSRGFASFGAADLGVGTFDFMRIDVDNATDDVPTEVSVFGIVAQQGVVGEPLNAFGVVHDTRFGCLCPDFDGNGSIGDGDLTLLLANWGKAVPPVPAGWTGAQPTAPGIGDDELTSLLSGWGQSPLTVPEPNVTALAASVLLSAAIRRLR